MDKGTKNSGIPVFGEIVKLLDKQKINILAEEMGSKQVHKASCYAARKQHHEKLICK